MGPPCEPGLDVVGFGPGWWSVATREDAALVADGEGDALVAVEEALGQSEVQDRRVASEHQWQEAGVAGQPAGLCGRDGGAGRQRRFADCRGEFVFADGDHDGCVGDAVFGQRVGGEVFEEFDERAPHPLAKGELGRVGLGGRTFRSLEVGAAR